MSATTRQPTSRPVKTDEERREASRQRSREWRQRPENQQREREAKARLAEQHPERVAAQKARSRRRWREKVGPEAINAANAERRRVARDKVLEAYGRRCSCPGCHVVHEVLLTIDHVGGDGATERKRYGPSTFDCYKRIIRLGFPDAYALLCGSCNLAKRSNAACPLAGQEH